MKGRVWLGRSLCIYGVRGVGGQREKGERGVKLTRIVLLTLSGVEFSFSGSDTDRKDPYHIRAGMALYLTLTPVSLETISNPTDLK